MIKTWQIEVRTLPRVFRFDGRLRGKRLTRQVYLAFTAGKMREPLKVLLRDGGLPEVCRWKSRRRGTSAVAMDDASVWAAITAPIGRGYRRAVAPVIRMHPRRGGQIHGQTSGVRIHAIGDDGMAHVSAWRTEDERMCQYIRHPEETVRPNRAMGC